LIVWPIDTPKLFNTKWLNEVQINQNAKGVRGTNGGKGKYLADSTDDSRVKLWTWSSYLSFTFRTHHSKRWAGFSYLSTKLEHSPQEINHYIYATIRILWGQVGLCWKVRTNLTNLNQFHWAQETTTINHLYLLIFHKENSSALFSSWSMSAIEPLDNLNKLDCF
jgi:hypothetical protein